MTALSIRRTFLALDRNFFGRKVTMKVMELDKLQNTLAISF
jgi:hypothetical protein